MPLDEEVKRRRRTRSPGERRRNAAMEFLRDRFKIVDLLTVASFPSGGRSRLLARGRCTAGVQISKKIPPSSSW